MSSSPICERLAAKAEDCLLRRDEFPGSAETEATAAVAYALLALFSKLNEGVVYVKDVDRV